MSMSGRFCAELEERALSDGRFLVSSGMSSTHSSQTISELSMVAVEVGELEEGEGSRLEQ